MMRVLVSLGLLLIFIYMSGAASCEVLVLHDPLNGGTKGTRSGGTFADGGWKVTGKYNYIYWHLPHTVRNGAVEFDVKGLNPNECTPGMEEKAELFHMYDYTEGDPDNNYGDYRDNSYKHFIRKNGCLSSYNNTVDCFELVTKIEQEYKEPDSSKMTWDPNTTYRIRQEWRRTSDGYCEVKTFRKEVSSPDFVLVNTMNVPGYYQPKGHSVKIGSSLREAKDCGAPINAVFSNIKVWDRSDVPPTPIITWPRKGQTINPNNATLRWKTVDNSFYQVRLTTVNNPNSGIVWDSGQVTSPNCHAGIDAVTSGTYYAFVRVGSGAGWSQWSALGHSFTFSPSYVEPNRGWVRVVGNSFVDDNGPFLGLAATYMCAMGKCKFYRDRYEDDLAFLAANGFNYIRILSMVGWEGREIIPPNYVPDSGKQPWSDYWQQFRDCIDLAYKYGLRTQITIFGDGQGMPSDADRRAHINTMLSNLVGREHKIMFIEVANEYWQNGFPDPGGVGTIRTYMQYLKDRMIANNQRSPYGTTIPVSGSATFGNTNDKLVEMYSGSAADVATEHFTRDRAEDSWLPVRDCWRVEDAPGVPPVVSNEPIGPGASVNSETSPIRLISAACYAWTAKLPAYCFHSHAGVYGGLHLWDAAAASDFVHLKDILPPDLASWTRNDGKEQSAPFTVFCKGTANKYWIDAGYSDATEGCHQNIGAIKDEEFVCYPQGIKPGGLDIRARKPVRFKVYNPLTGEIAYDLKLDAGESTHLDQGPGAYIIRGEFISDYETDRYLKDASGKPVFLLGYYDWASVAPGYYIDHPSQYSSMITQGAPYKINYIRISLGINRFTNSTNPPVYSGNPTPVPFKYINGKADLEQWDPVFWDGLRAQCELARQNGMLVHIAFFDGVDLRPCSEAYRWSNSYWNIDNQVRNFYGDLDTDNDCNVDEHSDFYRTTDFQNNTGVGYYQRALIDKTIAETAGYDNVFYEIGNELLSSPAAWNQAVIEYVKSKTTKPITQNGGTKAPNLDGWSQHVADTPAQVKANVAEIVGLGYAAWEDSDGPALRAGTPDELRQAAWYSFTGGAAGWGGFSTDFWESTFNTTKAQYYKNLATFIEESGVRFWKMQPQHELVSNNGINSCLAAPGSEYVAYVLNDASINLDLSAMEGDAYYRTFDPKAGTWSGWQNVAGGAIRQFTRPAGADDWVVHVRTADVPIERTLLAKPATNITVDGNPSDWNLFEFTNPIRGGQSGSGDFALVGYDENELYYAGYWTTGVLPESPADHTAKVYCRQDSSHIYFLVRCDDDDIRHSNGVTMNWANDCVEFYIDPSNDHGTAPLSASASDIQLVIDAANRKNVYQCTSTYRSQLLSGVTSAVVKDSTGWWLEAKIAKSVLDPDIPATGNFGIDFSFRDNDGENNFSKTTVYTWSDMASGTGFPSKIPSHWGDVSYATDMCLWESFSYANGNLNGNIGWSGSTTNQIVVSDGALKIIGGAGAYDAIRVISCDGGGSGAVGVWLKIKRGVGTSTMWGLRIDDSANRNLARWYGTGSLARGRIGDGSQVTPPQELTGGWDDLYVKIDFVANTSAFYFNGSHIGTLNHSETGAGDSIGRFRFERPDYAPAAGDYVWLDELRAGAPDVVAPVCGISEPSVAITQTGPATYSVTFSEPVYGFDSASDIAVSTTGSASVGATAISGSGYGPYTVTLSGLSGSGSAAISVNAGACWDVSGNTNAASDPSTPVKIVSVEGSIAQIKQLPDDSPVELASKVLYLRRDTFGYIEEQDRACGIRVQGAISEAEGSMVYLTGTVRTAPGGERYILVDAMGTNGSDEVEPLGVNNRDLMDDILCGMFVRTWGKVKPGSVTATSFVITDESTDTGIKVITPGAPGVVEGEYVAVSGAAGLDGVRVLYKK